MKIEDTINIEEVEELFSSKGYKHGRFLRYGLEVYVNGMFEKVFYDIHDRIFAVSRGDLKTEEERIMLYTYDGMEQGPILFFERK